MSESKGAVVDVVASAATKTTYTGAAGGFIAHLLAIDVLAWFGIAVAVGGFIVNWYYKRQENARADEIHRLKVKELEGQCNVK